MKVKVIARSEEEFTKERSQDLQVCFKKVEIFQLVLHFLVIVRVSWCLVGI